MRQQEYIQSQRWIVELLQASIKHVAVIVRYNTFGGIKIYIYRTDSPSPTHPELMHRRIWLIGEAYPSPRLHCPHLQSSHLNHEKSNTTSFIQPTKLSRKKKAIPPQRSKETQGVYPPLNPTSFYPGASPCTPQNFSAPNVATPSFFHKSLYIP